MISEFLFKSMSYTLALLSPAIRAMYINVSRLQSHKYIDRKRAT